MIKKGVYQHYKGGRYRIIGCVKHSETLEDMVLYEALYPNSISRMWVRPLALFTEKVSVNGSSVPRFSYVGDQ